MDKMITPYPTPLPYPFASAVAANGFLFLSGQVSMNGQGEPLPGSITEQTQRVMEGIIATLERCGSSLSKVVKVNVWLSDMAHFDAFNACYRPYFAPDFPARTTLVSRLAFDLDIEIEVQALA